MKAEIVKNFNDKVIIYPNENGYREMKQILILYYRFTDYEVDEYIKGKMVDGGYCEQLWVIMNQFHSMFFNGQKYFKSMELKFV